MGDEYEWRGNSASFTDGSAWDNFTTGQSPAGNAPGPADDAVLSTDGVATVSGAGDVDTLQIEDNITITGSLTAENSITFLPVSDSGSSTLDGGTLDGKSSIGISYGTFDVVAGGVLTTNGLTDYGMLVINTGTITAQLLGVGDGLLLTGADVFAANVGVGSNPGVASTLDVGSGSTITASFGGVVGMTTGDVSAATVHSGGVWNNNTNLIVGMGSTATLAVTSGGHVGVTGNNVPAGSAAFMAGFGGSGRGVVTVDGNGSVLHVGANAVFAAPSATAAVTISSGGLVEVDGTLSAGTADIDVNGGSLEIGQGLTMSEVASTLEVEGGGTVTGPNFYDETTGSGGMTIDGSLDVDSGTITGHFLNAVGPMTVADGTISSNQILLGGNTGGVTSNDELQSGGFLNAALFEIGPQSGDKAILNTFSGSTIQASQQILVGAGGSGGLGIQGLVKANGGIGEDSDAALDVGAFNAAAIGTVELNGTGATLDVTGAAVIGDAGYGSLEVIAAATFHVTGGLYEGVQSTGGGFLSIDAATDVFSVEGDWVIGDAGRHYDTIQNGAVASIGGSLSIARGAGGAGGLTITGSGSAVGVVGDIDVGANGNGTLQVESQGSLSSSGGSFVVTTGSADIGSAAGISAASATIGAAGTLTLTDGTLAADAVTVGGSVSGHGTITGSLSDTGTVAASGGTLIVEGLVNGTGVLAVNGATLELKAGVAAGPSVAFSGGTLLLDTPGEAGATMTGFAGGDTIVLKGVIANSGTYAGGVLTLEDGSAPQATLNFSGAYDSDSFSVVTLGNETDVTYAPCFATGTGIATVRGRVAVEDLRVGDRVPTLSGRLATIRWIGHRALDLRRHPRPQNVMPVRVLAGAFGQGVPARDLLLSPDHAVLVTGTLIPVRHLINGRSIVQEERARVTYWHVELDRHDVMLAEGLPCESYLDTGNRHAFEGAAALDLHPDFAQARSLAIWNARGCAAIATRPSDPRLRAAHTALLAAAWRGGQRPSPMADAIAASPSRYVG